VLAETLAVLAGLVRELSLSRPETVVARWRALAPSASNSRVEWETPAGRLCGTTAGIADDGALLVQVEGRLERIISGELRWM
jgi:biotin-(acetyl-CoA carboxylase) ligase